MRGAGPPSAKMNHLLGGGVLGDSLGALRDGVFGEFTRQQQSDGGLDLPTGDGGLPVVVGQTGCLGSDALEDVVDEAVHDRHGAAGDTGVRVDLLHHLVDVNGVRFPPCPLPFSVPWGTRCL